MKYLEKHHCVWLGHDCPLKETSENQHCTKIRFVFISMASQNIDRNALVEKINSFHACFPAENNWSSSNWLLIGGTGWIRICFPPELFCLGAVWKRHNNYWIILELMISSDAISLNIWVNIAGRISSAPSRIIRMFNIRRGLLKKNC